MTQKHPNSHLQNEDHTNSTVNLNKYQKTKSEVNINVGEFIADSNSFNHNLSNVISGINHEVAPWLGGALNTIARLKREMVRELAIRGSYDGVEQKWLRKLDTVSEALLQASEIMATVSLNVKRLKKHSVEKTSILNTVQSWFTIIFVNDTIKTALNRNQIVIDKDSLTFNAWHSPMLLSQVFLNLVKNAIDHNPQCLELLTIRIYGMLDTLIIEDNGTGVSESILCSIFIPEVTTKVDHDLHGLGLAICKEYCTIMGADIFAENAQPHGLRLRIKFAPDS
jgi:signal transduction histidine kinase